MTAALKHSSAAISMRHTIRGAGSVLRGRGWPRAIQPCRPRSWGKPGAGAAAGAAGVAGGGRAAGAGGTDLEPGHDRVGGVGSRGNTLVGGRRVHRQRHQVMVGPGGGQDVPAGGVEHLAARQIATFDECRREAVEVTHGHVGGAPALQLLGVDEAVARWLRPGRNCRRVCRPRPARWGCRGPCSERSAMTANASGTLGSGTLVQPDGSGRTMLSALKSWLI